MTKSPLPRLKDILDEINALEETLSGLSFNEYETSWKIRRACEHALLIISEASRHLPQDIKAKHLHIEWLKIADLGNVLRHEYHHVDDQIVWNIYKKHLPPLKKAIEAMIEENNK